MDENAIESFNKRRKKAAMVSREMGRIIDAPRPRYVSKSILKAQNEHAYKVSTLKSAKAENLRELFIK